MNRLCSGPSQGGFPDEDWDPLLTHYRGNGADSVRILGNTVTLGPPPDPAECECATVMSLVELRTFERVGEIHLQAYSRRRIVEALIEALRKQVGVSARQVDLVQDIAGYSLDLIEPEYFKFKVHYNRARPWNCCGDALSPLFPKGHDLYPGHPAYPSGHSTQVHTVAFLLASCRPDWVGTVLQVAARVALNRELAGLHFPSDSASGRRLGAAFADAIEHAQPSDQDSRWHRFKADFDELRTAK
jgi:hypothetical protein